MKQLIIILIGLYVLGFQSQAQNTEYIYNQNEVHFYGLDFSQSKMIGDDFDQESKIVEHYFRAWNDLLFVERDKYNVERLFDFKKAFYYPRFLDGTNRMVDANSLRTNGSHKIERAKIFEAVRNYNLPQDAGLGMVIFVETFNEYNDESVLYYAFFDIESRDLILIQQMKGETGGVGFRNSWANSIHFTMEEWKRLTYRQIVLDKIALLPQDEQHKFYTKVADEYEKDDVDFFVQRVEKRLRKNNIEMWSDNYYVPLPVPSNAVLAEKPKRPTNTEIKKDVSAEKPAVVKPSNYVSSVDINIPQGAKKNEYRYALIIGNEDYQSYQPTLSKESNVDYANRDAEVFKRYAEQVLGIPTENIVYLLDAKIVELNRALIKINKAIELSNGKAEVVFYYAGHGFPDQNTKDAYLIPVDVSATDLKYAFKMNDIYKTLTEFESKRITVFLDACFSGGARNKGLMSARGVKIVPKADYLDGNIVIFSASSGNETAQPFHKERHGLFTYYLLKKLQETGGNTSYSDMQGYLKENVGIKAVFVNESEQTPQINSSPAVGEEWKKWKFN
ncbi:MAG: hypothetical protein CL840_08645 [Crocinitomicaceae bacterium]|nr:hypothetical protein [Crocinitomicaceae bacterium]|tara:strand:- start:28800 stop:30479 length:1680 start_codon:yes stop_codon:yes gene_type:complete